MSCVFLCVDNSIHKKWAVKIIKHGQAGERSESSEIALLKSLDYYMFPRITDAFFGEDYLGIVTDYIEGENLSSYLKREGPLPLNTALRYFEELLLSLEYLHSQNPAILYLDMKPDNIMIRSDGEIRLIDFGIAGSILLKSKSLGSIGYSPPEQYLLGEKLNEKSDVFALAMTLYTMLTGKKPHKDLSYQTDIIKNDKSIPTYLRELIIKCINKDPKARPKISEILHILKNKSGSEKGALPIVIAFSLTIVLILASFIFLGNMYRNRRYENYKNEMLRKASEYMENGEYSRRGIYIICGYLNGNYLDKETEEFYTYEVARNYFEVQKDYASAQYYFNKLSSEKYPKVNEYLLLCKRMRGFDNNDERLVTLMQGEVEGRR